MKFRPKRLTMTLLSLFLITTSAFCTVDPAMNQDKVVTMTNTMNMPFLENIGQITDSNIRYYANTFACTFSITKNGELLYSIPSDKKKAGPDWEIREQPVGASISSITGMDKKPFSINYFKGNNPKKWIRGIPSYEFVNVGDIYNGVQLRLRAHGNNVEKLFHIRPGGDPENIRLKIHGSQKLTIDADGELNIDTASGVIRFSKPVGYQQFGEELKFVETRYWVKGNTYGFKIGSYDKSRELIIDPLIASFFIRKTDEYSGARAMAADKEGNIYVAGYSDNDCFIVKINSKLDEMLESALFGGAASGADDLILDIALDSQGNVFVAGYTESSDFPITDSAFDKKFGELDNYEEGFITKLDSDLSNILSSTFIGGGYIDRANAIVIDDNDQVYVTGHTRYASYSGSEDDYFPTTNNAYDTDPGKDLNTKVFISKLDNNLERLLASTYLGGADTDDFSFSISIDSAGSIIVAGATESPDFPTTNGCVDGKYEGANEGFVAKLDATLETLQASTYLGGINEEAVEAVVLDAADNIYAAGWTKSSNFPVTEGSYDTSHNLNEDAFVAVLDNKLQKINHSTFIGGSEYDRATCIDIFKDWGVFIAGRTVSSDYPATPGWYDDSYNGGKSYFLPSSDDEGDGFITLLDKDLTTNVRSTFFGGEDGVDCIYAILTNGDDMYAAGQTYSDDFPLLKEMTGFSEAFVSRFNENETPPAPDPTPTPIVPGHWTSSDHVAPALPDRLYYDIDICPDGSFGGTYSVYACVFMMVGCYCQLEEFSPVEAVTGFIDYDTGKGTMTIENCDEEIPIDITENSTEKIAMKLKLAGHCEWTENLYTELYYIGDAGDYCKDKSGDNSGGDTGGGGGGDGDGSEGSSGGGGGGGGGCFISTVSD